MGRRDPPPGVFWATRVVAQGPSYGDHGLALATAYAWQVTAVVGGIEQSPSPSASGGDPADPSHMRRAGKLSVSLTDIAGCCARAPGADIK
jgi:hypothetical protein